MYRAHSSVTPQAGDQNNQRSHLHRQRAGMGFVPGLQKVTGGRQAHPNNRRLTVWAMWVSPLPLSHASTPSKTTYRGGQRDPCWRDTYCTFSLARASLSSGMHSSRPHVVSWKPPNTRTPFHRARSWTINKDINTVQFHNVRKQSTYKESCHRHGWGKGGDSGC